MSIIDYWQFPFVQNAFWSGILISVVAAILGTLIVVNRMVFSAEGLAHCAFGGIGMGLYFRLPPLLSAVVFAVVFSFIFSYLSFKESRRSDTIVGVLMAAGMALGILFLNAVPGYKVEPLDYLFGSIMLVGKSDIFYLLLFDFLLVALFFPNYRTIMAISADPEFMAARAIRVGLYYLILNFFIAMGVVLAIKMVGLILLLALLTMAPYIVEKYVSSLKAMVWGSLFLNIILVNVGLFLSLKLNLRTGPTIVLVGAIIFLLDFIVYTTFFKKTK